jgi:hypothetical protein
VDHADALKDVILAIVLGDASAEDLAVFEKDEAFTRGIGEF